MHKPFVIIVTGAPGTGKTTLAQWLADQSHLPLLCKDAIKEMLFDELGWSDRAWSRKLGQASIALLFSLIEVQLRAGQSLITESNFMHPWSTRDFLRLQQCYPFIPFQILCSCDTSVLAQRFTARANSPERHPGHVEVDNMEEFMPTLLQGRIAPLEIGGTLYELDTTDLPTIDYKKLLQAIEEARDAAHATDANPTYE